jgi:hypothetical protein
MGIIVVIVGIWKVIWIKQLREACQSSETNSFALVIPNFVNPCIGL